MQTSFSPRERNITLAAVMVVFLLGALDNTIVSTAMPRIIAQLDGLSLYTWVTTAYLLASTVMVPIYGKLSDIFGRKPILITGISIFLIGSMLCGLAGEFGSLPLIGNGMIQLVVFRALQGLGGAALFSSAFAIIADMIPPAERGKYQGLFGGVFGLASVLGPIIGGFFTDHGTVTLLGYEIAGWRWVFYVNLPLGLFALFLIGTQMPDLKFGSGKGKIDYLGAALIIITFVPLLLGLTWAGSTYPWGSTRIISLFAVSLVSLILFLIVEAKVSNPILPLELFKNRIFALSNLASFIVNIAFLGIVMFLPLFMQLVLGISATNSGFTLLPLMAGLIISSTISGLIVTKLGHYKPLMLFGVVVLLLGTFLLTSISLETTLFGLAWRMVIVGIGLGPAQSLFTLAIQNAVPMTQLGIATSASQFFRQIGSTIGLAIFGSLLTLSVSSEIPKYIPNLPGMESQKFDIGALNGIGENSSLKDALASRFDELYTQVEAALNGDEASQTSLLANPLVPEQLRQVLTNTADLTPEAKTQVLSQLQASLTEQADTLSQGLEHGIKQGFAVSIRHLFTVGFWILVAGALIIVFIPDQTLRKRMPGNPATENDGETAVALAHD
ncbi:MAG: MFS transporter [Trueperaceae bacterium]|nr:MFS transporter [Trueperaceae bacterium]